MPCLFFIYKWCKNLPGLIHINLLIKFFQARKKLFQKTNRPANAHRGWQTRSTLCSQIGCRGCAPSSSLLFWPRRNHSDVPKMINLLKRKKIAKVNCHIFDTIITFHSFHVVFLSISPGARIYVPTQLRHNIYNWSFQILEINLGELSIMEVNCSQSLASQGIQCRRSFSHV